MTPWDEALARLTASKNSELDDDGIRPRLLWGLVLALLEALRDADLVDAAAVLDRAQGIRGRIEGEETARRTADG